MNGEKMPIAQPIDERTCGRSSLILYSTIAAAISEKYHSHLWPLRHFFIVTLLWAPDIGAGRENERRPALNCLQYIIFCQKKQATGRISHNTGLHRAIFSRCGPAL